jgi:hypothetical protein
MSTPEGRCLFEVIGFKLMDKRDGSEVWEAEFIDSALLEFMLEEIDCFLRQCWSDLLPSLLQVLHFHLRVREQHSVRLSSRDSRELYGDKFGKETPV